MDKGIIKRTPKFKKGDKVIISNTSKESTRFAKWATGMDKYNGKVTTIVDWVCSDQYVLYSMEENIGYWFDESWLTKAEDSSDQIPELSGKKPLPDEIAKAINWEQRRWDLISTLVLNGKHIEIAIGIADETILRYIETL